MPVIFHTRCVLPFRNGKRKREREEGGEAHGGPGLEVGVHDKRGVEPWNERNATRHPVPLLNRMKFINAFRPSNKIQIRRGFGESSPLCELCSLANFIQRRRHFYVTAWYRRLRSRHSPVTHVGGHLTRLYLKVGFDRLLQLVQYRFSILEQG